MVYTSTDQIDFEPADCPALPRPGRVLLASPDHYDVRYVINPHMEGNVGEVDTALAAEQWRALRTAYETLGLTVNTIEGVEDLPDMVFTANQTLPFYDPDGGARGVVPARMRPPERRDEVAHVEKFFRALGYDVRRLRATPEVTFEGAGDALWHPGRYLLWGGYGFRTDPGAYRLLADLLGARVVLVELRDPDFYHLDTCLAALDETTALVYPGALAPEGRALVARLFDRVVEAPEDEARHGLACNAHCPDGQHVLLPAGCPGTAERLREAGFLPVEIEVSEFVKAGGAVACMKQAFW